jgi:hypothetical protein
MPARTGCGDPHAERTALDLTDLSAVPRVALRRVPQGEPSGHQVPPAATNCCHPAARYGSSCRHRLPSPRLVARHPPRPADPRVAAGSPTGDGRFTRGPTLGPSHGLGWLSSRLPCSSSPPLLVRRDHQPPLAPRPPRCRSRTSRWSPASARPCHLDVAHARRGRTEGGRRRSAPFWQATGTLGSPRG